MKIKTIMISVVALLAATLFAACDNHAHDEEEHDHEKEAADNEHEHSADEIHLLQHKPRPLSCK